MPEDERAAIARHVRELDRLGEDLAVLDRDIAQDAIDDEAIQRLLTITGVNLTVAAGLMAAIGSIDRFNSPQKLESYFGLNPRVRQSGLGPAHHGRISKAGRCWSRRPEQRRKHPDHCGLSSSASERAADIRSPQSLSHESSRPCAGTC